MMEKVFAKLDKDTVYSITGNQFMELNTLFQLMALKENQPELLQKAETLLLSVVCRIILLFSVKIWFFTV